LKQTIVFFLFFSSLSVAFADGPEPYPKPNESGKSVFYSVSDLFRNAGIAVTKELSKLSDSLRSRADLLAYKKMSPRYGRDYAEIVEMSATHFSIPETFLACLINKESAFEPMAVSPMGAKGIMQFMDEAVIAFNRQIRYDDYSKAAWGTFPFKSGKVPTRIGLSDVWNPDIMIPAGALRFKTRALSLFGDFAADKWTLPQLTILVADYSSGPSGLANHCGYNLPKNSRDPAPLDNDAIIEDCMNRLNPDVNKKAVHETWEEMLRVSDCMIGLPKVDEPKREPSAIKPSALGRPIKKTF
jgi:hypothetical protein